MAYNENFIPAKRVPLPEITGPLKKEIAPLVKGEGHVLDYAHHSVVMNAKRRVAFFAAANVSGKDWKKVERTGGFQKDRRLAPEHQLGPELYDAIKATDTRPNDFEQGHLTSFQEVLWGKTQAERVKAGADTFFFTNCVPQHERVNSGLWRSLEQYILKTETVNSGLRVTVMTGPLLSNRDPWYIKKIDNQYIKLPVVFWKVIYYENEAGLNAVGFMMSHKQLVLKDETVSYTKGAVRAKKPIPREITEYFMDYEHGSVYQVDVNFIEQETGLKFMLDGVRLPYKQKEKKEVIYKRVEVRGRTRSGGAGPRGGVDFAITGLTL